MTYTAQELLDQIAAGEDSRWEFKRVEFAGTRLRSPERRVAGRQDRRVRQRSGPSYALRHHRSPGIGVAEIPGSAHRRFFMERRGDGVPTIIRETRGFPGGPLDRTYLYASNIAIAVRGQNPPGIRTAMHPRWPLRLTYPHCKAHITFCHVHHTCCRSKAPLCVAPLANSAAIPPSSRLASPAEADSFASRCGGCGCMRGGV